MNKLRMRGGGFTLVELLTVIAIIAILVGVLLPGLGAAKRAGQRKVCASNLGQVGKAIVMYAADHHGRLPGALDETQNPLWQSSIESRQLYYHLWRYLGLDRQNDKDKLVRVLVCPGWKSVATDNRSPAYLLNTSVELQDESRKNPWNPALKIQELAEPSVTWAMQDLDTRLKSVANAPNKPVHGNVRNQLFFDAHVDTAEVK